MKPAAAAGSTMSLARLPRLLGFIYYYYIYPHRHYSLTSVLAMICRNSRLKTGTTALRQYHACLHVIVLLYTMSRIIGT